jgi:hypothetical protein
MRATPAFRPVTLRWLLSYWLIALATHASGLWQPMHCDYSCRLRVAREWASGKALYRQTYDNPQPVVFLWLLAIDSPRPAVSAYLAETALAAGACLVFRAALLRVFPRLAGLIPIFLIVFSGVSSTFYAGQIAEAPAMWLDVIGLSCFWLALRPGRTWLALIAGISYILMVGFRVPSALNIVSWLVLVATAGASRPKSVRTTAAAVAGAALALGALYIHARVDGYWGDFVAVFRRNLSYGSLDRVPLGVSLVEGAKTLGRIALSNTLVGLLLVMSTVMLMALRKQIRRVEWRWIVVAGVWLLAAVASAFPGGRHYAHYYHLIWPAIAVLSMVWLAPLRREFQNKSGKADCSADALACAIVTGVVLMGIAGQLFEGAKAVRDLRRGTHAWNTIEEATIFLNRETKSDTSVLVNVWLDWAELYWRVPRPAPSLSIPHVVPRDLYGRWLSETTMAMPEWVVTDATPWEPIDGPLTDANEKEALDQFVAALDRDYALKKQFGQLRILRRKGGP